MSEHAKSVLFGTMPLQGARSPAVVQVTIASLAAACTCADPGMCPQASPGKGEYSTIAGIDNSGNSLPAGYTDKPLSASELAQVEASKSRSKVQQTTSNAATVASPASDAGQQVQTLKPSLSALQHFTSIACQRVT